MQEILRSLALEGTRAEMQENTQWTAHCFRRTVADSVEPGRIAERSSGPSRTLHRHRALLQLGRTRGVR